MSFLSRKKDCRILTVMDKDKNMKNCYLCGKTKNITKDHVPPKSFFSKPRPRNLITVPCCRICNQEFSKDEEAFRIFAAGDINRSYEGGKIWEEKVMGSTFKRSPKLRKNVIDCLGSIPIQTNTGLKGTLPYLVIPVDRVNNFLVKMTKGFIYHFYPNLKRNEFVFEVTQLNKNAKGVQEAISMLYADKRGKNTFDFWRGISPETGDGLWIYTFYNAQTFMINHKLNP